MSRWYRAYAGTVKDDKLAEVSVIAGCSRSVAIAVWHSVLESAAETDDGGRFETTPRRVAAALCEPLAAVQSVFDGMAEIGMIGGDSVTAWKSRQYESDKSTERSRKHREAKRNADKVTCNGGATLQGRSATPPDTETDTEDTASAVSERARLPYDEIETKCRKAAGLEQDPSPSLCDLSPVIQFLDAGADLERQILPVIRAKRRDGIRSWRFFVPSLTEALAAKPPIIAKPKTFEQEESWRGMLKSFAGGYWNDHWGPPPDSPACTIPAEFIASFPEALEIMDRQSGRSAA